MQSVSSHSSMHSGGRPIVLVYSYIICHLQICIQLVGGNYHINIFHYFPASSNWLQGQFSPERVSQKSILKDINDSHHPQKIHKHRETSRNIHKHPFGAFSMGLPSWWCCLPTRDFLPIQNGLSNCHYTLV